MTNESSVQENFSVTIDLLTEYLIKIAIVEFPFLNIPIVKQLFTFIIKRIVSKAKIEGELMISFAFIDKEVSERKDAYNKAISDFKEVIKSDAPEEKKNEALNEVKNRLRDLIRFPAE